MDVTVIILTKNEARSLPACLASLTAFADVHVVDSGSDDGTQGIATLWGASVHQFQWDGNYPKKKQWSLENVPCRFDWVLLLDADERVSPSLSLEIAKMSGQGPSAFDVELDYYFLGRRLRWGHKVRKRVLMRRSDVAFPVLDDLDITNMWEVEGHYQPQLLRGSIGRLESSLQHADDDPLFDYYARHNRYSDWEARMRSRGNAAAARSRAGRYFYRVPLKPVVFMLYSYIFRLGFLDGYPGFAMATSQMFYYFQIDFKEFELRDSLKPLDRR